MANPTTQVPITRTEYVDTKTYWPMTGARSPYEYQAGSMMGFIASGGNAGYADLMDDSQSLKMLGILVGGRDSSPTHVYVDSSTNGAYAALVDRPYRFAVPLISGTASRLTDIGKAAYAVDAGHVTLDPNATTNKNLVGYVEDVGGTSQPDAMTGTLVYVSVAGANVGLATSLAGAAGTGAEAGQGVTATGGAGGATGAGGTAVITGGAGGATSGAGGAASITGGAAAGGNSNGGAASVVGGLGHGTGVGGAAAITGGASGSGATGAGGAVTLTGGASNATNDAGGAISLVGGAGAGTGNGGAINLTSGAAGATGVAGAIAIAVGAATAGAGSNITLTAGNGAGGTAAGGNVNLVPGTAVSTGVPGEIQVNGNSAIEAVAVTLTATDASRNVFIATRACRFKAVSVIWTTGSSSGTLNIEKCTGTTAPGSGTALLTGNVSLAGTGNTVATGTLIATVASLTLAAGDRLGIVIAGTMTSLANCTCTIMVTPV